MDHVLLEAFRHGAWATKALISAFRLVPPAERERPGYLGPLRTLNHLVLSEGSLVHALRGTRPEWAWPRDETRDLDELEARADRVAALWEETLAGGIEGEDRVVLGDAYELTAATVVLQALYLGHTQREQANRILQDVREVARADLGPSAFAMATGRGRALPGAFPGGPGGG